MSQAAVIPTAAIVVAMSVVGAAPARGQPDGSATPDAATVLVAPQGGTADVPVRFSSNVLLTFPSPLAPRVVQSSADWEVRDFAEGVVARALTPSAQPTTLALATRDGAVKVNITLRLVPEAAAALTLVRFQSATAEEAFAAAVDAEVARRTAAMEAALARDRAAMDAAIHDRADRLVARGLRARLEVRRLKAHARNRDHVVVHGQRVVLLGDDAYVLFELENRSAAAYRLATVQLVDPAGVDRAGPVVVVPAAAAGDAIGIVPAGASGHATVVVRHADAILGKPLTLIVAEHGGRNRVVVDRGIAIR
jgi:hypothetical protein